MKRTEALFRLVFAFCSRLAAPDAPTTAQGNYALTLAVGVDWMAGMRAGRSPVDRLASSELMLESQRSGSRRNSSLTWLMSNLSSRSYV